MTTDIESLIHFSWRQKPSPRFLQKVEEILGEPSAPLGFLKLPDAESLKGIKDYADSQRKKIDHYCIVGIGGSAIPARSIQSFFRNSNNGSRSIGFWVLDTLDPETLHSAFEALLANPQKSLFHIISKSGSTLEVDLIHRYLSGALEKKDPYHWKDRFVITTTPGKDNPLYDWGRHNRIRFFDLAEDIGGRYSSFSPVAYLSAALMGLDVLSLAQGGLAMAKRLGPACRYAELIGENFKKGRKMMGLFLYGDELADFGELLIQLFAESLGKSGKGITPIKFIGPRDQHSTLQLYLDGPKDKMVTLISTPKETHSHFGRAFWAAQEGVYASLKKQGVPVWRISVGEKTAQAYGGLVQFFHLSVLALSSLFHVNPFDQPMVELQKRYTHQFLKRFK